MLLTITAAVVVLGVLIFVHELGHFMAAKAVGIGVPKFSIGLGPATPLRFARGETEYVVSWIPFGGYVRMATREEQEMAGSEVLEGGASRQKFPPERMFESKPLWARIIVICAGVFMNALFAWLVYVLLAGVYGRVEDPTTTIAAVNAKRLPATARALAGIPFGTQILYVNDDTVASWNDVRAAVIDPKSDRLRFDFAGDIDPIVLPISGTQVRDRLSVYYALQRYREPRIGFVIPGSPAEEAGLEIQDLVLTADGDTVRYWNDMVDVFEPNAGEAVALGVLRGDSIVTLSVVPRAEQTQDPVTGQRMTVGKVGIAPWFEPRRVRYGVVEASVAGSRRLLIEAGTVWFALKGLVLRRISPRELGGPILIAQISGQVARIGLEAFLGFMAFFSINLAILNLLPIPVLDGGHLVFLLIEGVRGKPLSVALRMRLSQIGLTLLLGIMLLAFSNDLFRLFGR